MYSSNNRQRTYTLILMMFLSVNLGISQIPELLKKEVQYRVKNHINPSIAVGLTDSTGTHFYVHGWKDLEKQIKADQHTLYEIGSSTKSFTGLLLGKFILEDSLYLETGVNKFLPDSIDLTDIKRNQVSLESLA